MSNICWNQASDLYVSGVVIAVLGNNFKRKTGSRRVISCLKDWIWIQSVVFLLLKEVHEKITSSFTKCWYSGQSKVSWRSYEILCCLIDTCLLNTEINSNKIQGLFSLSGKAVNKVSTSISCSWHNFKIAKDIGVAFGRAINTKSNC